VRTFESAFFSGTPASITAQAAQAAQAAHASREAAAAAAAADAIVLDSFSIDAAERTLIQRALEHTAGNRTRAAELLGISVRTLRSKLNTPDAGDVD
jgi:two-component system, response regulator FlrC